AGLAREGRTRRVPGRGGAGLADPAGGGGRAIRRARIGRRAVPLLRQLARGCRLFRSAAGGIRPLSHRSFAGVARRAWLIRTACPPAPRLKKICRYRRLQGVAAVGGDSWARCWVIRT